MPETEQKYLSIIIIVAVAIIIVFIYKTFETFTEEELKDVKLKTQQCNDCELIGKKDNSFIEIYKKSKN